MIETGGMLSTIVSVFALPLGVFNTLWLVYLGMRDRKKITVRVFPAKDDEENNLSQVRLAVSNTGRRPITIVAIGLYSKGIGYKYFGESEEGYRYSSSDAIPITLNESEWVNYWVFLEDCRSLAGPSGKVIFFLEDATGKRHASRNQQLDILGKAEDALSWHEFTSRYRPK